MERVQFSQAYPARLKVGVVGTGSAVQGWLLPCFQLAPVELVAVADPNTARGLAVARQVGARHFYPNHKAMLAQEHLDAVFMSLEANEQGALPYAEMAEYALKQGVHTWVDTPACGSLTEIKQMTYGLNSRGKRLQMNVPRMFAPVYNKVNELIHSELFDSPSSFALRYPAALPPTEARGNSLVMLPFLTDFMQAYSIPLCLFGECDGFSYLRSPLGDVVMHLYYRSGLVGSLHLTGSQAESSPNERLEVVGNGANLVAENATRLTYYRAEADDNIEQPGTALSFIGGESSAPLVWQPTMAPGMLAEDSRFISGYLGSVLQFCNALLENKPPRRGNISDLMHMVVVYEKLKSSPEKQWLSLF
ncbi:MAG: Gfo/Idh/MocA family oxidoreductase [Chloroflexi bacterium]|nr:Gfo/Idh/MocA family oxidoreductase [Chloroflexota bacterium]